MSKSMSHHLNTIQIQATLQIAILVILISYIQLTLIVNRLLLSILALLQQQAPFKLQSPQISSDYLPFPIYNIQFMTKYANYRIIVGILIICEAYILLNSSQERHLFQTNISLTTRHFVLPQLSYPSIQTLRYVLISMMYTCGAAMIFDEGVKFTLAYFITKSSLEFLMIINGVALWRSLLLISIYFGLAVVIRKIVEEKEARVQQKQKEQLTYEEGKEMKECPSDEKISQEMKQ